MEISPEIEADFFWKQRASRGSPPDLTPPTPLTPLTLPLDGISKHRGGGRSETGIWGLPMSDGVRQMDWDFWIDPGRWSLANHDRVQQVEVIGCLSSGEGLSSWCAVGTDT